MQRSNKIAGTLGLALMGAVAAAQASENPFATTELSQGYTLAAHHEGGEGKCGEGKCGEGKCGADKKAQGEGKCGEGKCGEGKCGADKKADKKADGEGKCGEGKCGAMD